MRYNRFRCIHIDNKQAGSIDLERRRSRINFRNLSEIAGFWVVAVTLAMTMGCSDDKSNSTTDYSEIGSGGTSSATGGMTATGGTGGTTPSTGGTGATGGTKAIDAGLSDGSASDQSGGSGGSTTTSDAATGPETGDAAQTEAGQIDAAQTDEAGQIEAGQTEVGQTEAGQTEAGQTEAGQTEAGQNEAGTIPPVDSVDEYGPYTPAIQQNVGPRNGSWVFYPEELGQDGVRHPIFSWGPGAGTGPSNYTDHLSQIASHGIVVISQVSTDNGNEQVAALDWIIAQNDDAESIYYQKLDTTKVGAGGHSRGSISTYAMGSDSRLVTTVQVCGSSFDGRGTASLHAPAILLGASGDFTTGGFSTDYNIATIPIVFITYQGSNHIMCARDNLAPWIAWLRWHLIGEEFRRSEFLDPNCTYCQSPWDLQSKNW